MTRHSLTTRLTALLLSWAMPATSVWATSPPPRPVPAPTSASPASAAPFVSEAVARAARRAASAPVEQPAAPTPLSGSAFAHGAANGLAVLSPLLAPALLADPAPAASEVSVFGPKVYLRTSGGPDLFEESVPVPAWMVSPYLLRVQNGEASGDDRVVEEEVSDDDDANRVTSATVDVNGVQILKQSDFKQNVPYLERTVDLTPVTTLEIRLASQPGSFLAIGLVGVLADLTPPQVSLATPIPGTPIADATPTLTLAYTDVVGSGEPAASGADPATLRVEVDGVDRTALFDAGESQASASWPEGSPLAEGAHSVSVSLADVAGNQASYEATFVVDTIAPSYSVVAPAEGAFLATPTPGLDVTFHDGGSGIDVDAFALRIDGDDRTDALAVTASGAAGTLGEPLADGVHSLEVTLADLAGNVASVVPRAFVVDTAAPSASVVLPADGDYLGVSPAALRIDYADPDAGAGNAVDTASVAISLDGAPATDAFVLGSHGADGAPPSALADGAHELSVTLADLAGNPASAMAGFVVDTQAPMLSIDDPVEGSFHPAAPLVVAGTASDADATLGIDCLVDGIGVEAAVQADASAAPGEPIDFSYTCTVGLAEGENVVEVVAADRFGHETRATRSVVLDTLLPELTITSPADADYTAAADVTLTGEVIDATPVDVTVNGVAATLSGTTFTATGVALGAGPEQVLEAVAVDAAGNTATHSITLRIDRDAPTLSVEAPTAGSYLPGPEVLVTGRVDDASPVGVTVNGVAAGVTPDDPGPFTGAPVAFEFSATLPVPDGPLTLDVQATDAAGNPGAAQVALSIDSAAPLLSLTAPADGLITNAPGAAVTGTLTDASPATLQLSVTTPDGASTTQDVPVAGEAFAIDVPLAAEGVYALRLDAVDAAGNAASTSVTTRRDTTPPAIAVTAPSDGAFLPTATPELRVSFGDDVAVDLASLALLLDGAEVTGQASITAGAAVLTPTLGEGPHQIVARLADAAGNVSEATSSFTLDVTLPVVGVVEPTAGAYLNAATPTLRVAFADAGSGIDPATVVIRLASDGGPAQDVTAAFAIGAGEASAALPLPDGAHVLSVEAADRAGQTASASAGFTVDRVPPELVLLAPADGAFVATAAPELRVAFADAVAVDATTLALLVDGVDRVAEATVAAGEATLSLELGEGSHAVVARIADRAGNISQAQASFLVDVTLPVVAVAEPVDGAFLNAATPALRVTFADAGSGIDPATVVIRLAGESGVPEDVTAAFALGASEASAALPLPDGAHVLSVEAADRAGQAASASAAFTLDRVAPTYAVELPAEGAFLATPTPEVLLRYQDDRSGVDTDALVLSVDGEPVAGLSIGPEVATATLGALADGTHTLTADVADRAGNIAPAAPRTFSVDTVAPTLAIVSPAASSYVGSSSVPLSVSFDDGEGSGVDPASVQVWLDGVERAAVLTVGPSGVEGSVTLGDGPHDVRVVAQDRAGNAAEVSGDFFVDTTPPSLPEIDPTDGVYISEVQPDGTVRVSGRVEDLDPSLSIECRIGGTSTTATIDGDSFYCDVPLSEGLNSLEIVASDSSGNSATLSRGIHYDSTPPSLFVDAPEDGAYTAATSIEVSGRVSDASPVSVTVEGVAATLAGGVFAASVPLGAGPQQSLTATALDAAGNSSQTSITINIDREVPAIFIQSPVDGAHLPGPVVEVAGTVTDASPVAVDVNGEIAIVSGDTFSVSIPVVDGPLTLVATARDAAGNVASHSVSVVFDTAPPQISVSEPLDGAAFNGTFVRVVGTLSDASPTTLRLGGELVPVAGGVFDTQAPLGAEGPAVLTLSATDAAGNTSSVEIPIVVDRTLPDLEVAYPPEGAAVGTLPLVVQGLVDDATPVSVTANGIAASLNGSAWQASLAGLPEGDNVVTVVATDAAGNVATVTRGIVVDLGPPILRVDAPTSGTLTNETPILVVGSVEDLSDVDVSITGGGPQAVHVHVSRPVGGAPFSAAVPLLEGDNTLAIVASDATGRQAQVDVLVTLDTAPPQLELTAPESVTRSRGGDVLISATDAYGIESVAVTLSCSAPDGGDTCTAGTTTVAGPPYVLALTVPEGAGPGDTLTLNVVATDRAGNVTSAARGVRVASEGVLVGAVLDDTTGLPLPGASVELVDASGDTTPVATDARGRYSLPATDEVAIVRASAPGMTVVERRADVASGTGTVPVDARLTPLAELATADDAGLVPLTGEDADPALTVSTTPGASVRVTPLTAQGLPGLLPLGWSPLAAVDLRDTGSEAVHVHVTRGLPPRPVHLAGYSDTTHAWLMVSPGLLPTAGALSVPLPGPGSYALVAEDVDAQPVSVPAAGEPLEGVALVEIPITAASTGVVEPAVLPPGGGTAKGRLRLDTPLALPSGTVVQAEVTETYALASGETASEESRLSDIVLTRETSIGETGDPEAPDSVLAECGDADGDPATPPSLCATLPITPARGYETLELLQGRVHLDILAGREGVRGVVGGNEAVTITAGDAQLAVAAGSLGEDTAIALEVHALSAFLPSASHLIPLGELFLDFSGESLGLDAALSIADPGLGLSEDDVLLVARVVRLDGVPYLSVVALATLQGERIVSQAYPGLPGISAGGRYVFYRSTAPIGFVAGRTLASGAPVKAVVATEVLPFIDIARPDGSYIVAAATGGGITLDAFVPETALQASATADVDPIATTSLDIILAGVVTTASVAPQDGAVQVSTNVQVELTTSAPLNPATVTAENVRLLQVGETSDTPVPVRLVLSGSGQLLAVVPEQALAYETTYRFEAAGMADVYGGVVAAAPATFTTKADTPPVYDLTAIVFGYPDENGIVTVTAPAGTLPPGTSILIINAGNGVVVTLTAGNDGELNGELPASIHDQLFVTVTDPFGNVATFTRSEYVAADGTTAVGPGGGTVRGPGGVELRIPEGALDAGVSFKIEGLTPDALEALFPGKRPDLGTDASGNPLATLGSGLEVTTSEGTEFKKEVDVAFPVPNGFDPSPDCETGGATPCARDAFYYVFKRLPVDPDGDTVVYETLDHAFVEGEGADAKVVTASYPFPGLLGFSQQVSYLYAMHTHLVDQAGRPLPGLVTGTVRRTTWDPGNPVPDYEPVTGAEVSGVDASGEPLASHDGEVIAISGKDGTFSLWDHRYVGGPLDVAAQSDDIVAEARAFEANPQDWTNTGAAHYRNIAQANITFPAVEPPGSEPDLDVVLFDGPGADRRRVTGGVVLAGTPLTVGIAANAGSGLTLTAVTINGATFSTLGDPLASQNPRPATAVDWLLADAFVPDNPGTYTVIATALPPIGGAVTATETFLVVSASGSGVVTLPDEPPAVITAQTFPAYKAQNVSTATYVEIAFTEPVHNIPGSVILEEASTGVGVPFRLVGVGVDEEGQAVVVDEVLPETVVTSLTLQPRSGLRFDTTYRIRVTSGVLDLDTDADGNPEPKALDPAPYMSEFTTFGPQSLTLAGDGAQFRSPGIAVLGERAYLSQLISGLVGNLRVFDVSNPVFPFFVEDETPFTFVGRPVELAGEIDSSVIGGRPLLAVITGSTHVPRPSNLYLVDVSDDREPLWVGAASLTTSAQQGFVTRATLRGSRLYAATARQGIQVVDLDRAHAQFQALPDGPQTRVLGLRTFQQVFNANGEGWGHDAVVATVPLPPRPGSTLPWYLTDIEVRDRVVGGISQPIVVAAGDPGIVIVNPQTAQRLFPGTLPMQLEGLGVTLEGVPALALGAIAGREVAVAVAKPQASNALVVAVIDLADLSAPVITGVLDLGGPEGISGIVGTSVTDVTLAGTLALVAGNAGTLAIDVSDALNPTLAGVVPGVAGRLQSVSGLVFGSAFSIVGGEDPLGGVRIANVDPSATAGGYCPLLSLQTPEVTLRLTQDAVNETRCGEPARIEFGLCQSAQVSFRVAGELRNASVDGGQDVLVDSVLLPPGRHILTIPPGFLGLAANVAKPFEIEAVALEDASARATEEGRIVSSIENRSVLPVGHTFVKGVDLFDGHLVRQATDLRQAGRHLGLEVTRTYSSAGISSEGLLGAGWSFNYESRLLPGRCETYTVITADGSSQVFRSEDGGETFTPQRGYHTQLRKNNGGESYTFIDKSGTEHHFREPASPNSESRRLDYIEEPHGDQVRVSYDAEGRVDRVGSYNAEDAGRAVVDLKFRYEKVRGFDRVASVTSSTGSRVEYRYDEWGNLIQAKRLGGNLSGQPAAPQWVEEYAYSVDDTRDRHQLVEVVGPNQDVTRYEFFTKDDLFPGESEDPLDAGYLVLHKEERVEVVREYPEVGGSGTPIETGFRYDATRFQSEARLEATVNDGRSNDTKYTLNGDGSPVLIEEPLGKTTEIRWRENDILKDWEKDAEDRETTFDYDPRGNLILERIHTAEFGDVDTVYAYDPKFNKLTSKRDAEDSETIYTIDPDTGDLRFVEDAEHNLTEYRYDQHGQLELVISPRGYQTIYTDHDLFGNPRRIDDPEQIRTTRSYDARGRLTGENDTQGHRREISYDGFDRVIEERRLSGGASANAVTTTEYYPGGQVRSTTNPLGAETVYTLDGLNRVVLTETAFFDPVHGQRQYEVVTDYDCNGNKIRETDRRDVTRRFDYDELNRLQVVVVEDGPDAAPIGQVMAYDYDLVGNKTQETDNAGRVTDFVYDGLYRVKEKQLPIVDADGARYSEFYGYDLVGNRTSFTDANDQKTTFDYDGLDRLIRRETPEEVFTVTYDDPEGSHVNKSEERDATRGLRTEFTYDRIDRELTRIVHLEGPGGEGQSYKTIAQYLDDSHSVTIEDPRGHVTRRVMDGLDRVVEEVVDDGGLNLTTRSVYDGLGNPLSVTDPRQETTEFEYDGLGRLRIRTDALTKQARFDYDGEGNRTEERDRRGVVTTHTYDNLSRPRASTTPGSLTAVPWSHEVQYVDQPNARRIEFDARRNRHIYDLDGLDRVVKVTDPFDKEIVTTWDGVNKRAEQDKRGHTTTFAYDGVNRPTLTTDPEQATNPLPLERRQSSVTYLDEQNQRIETDRRGIPTLTQLDPLGRVVSVTRAGIQLEYNEYDGNGNRTLSVDAEGNRTAFEYDGANRLVTRVDAEGSNVESATRFTYDENGNLETELDPRAASLGEPYSVFNVYDALNRLVSTKDGEGNETIYDYDPEGNRNLVKEPKGQETTFSYGERGEPVRVTQEGGLETEYAYDPNRNRVTQTDAEDRVVEMRYDALNRLEQRIQDPDGLNLVTEYGYDENGNQTSLLDPKGQTVGMEYDELNRVSRTTYAFAQGVTQRPWRHTTKVEYRYDANSNLEGVDEFVASGTDPPEILTTIRGYDPLDRLEFETSSLPDGGLATVVYTYYGNGNRDTVRDPSGRVTHYAYDAKNRLRTATTDFETPQAATTRYEYEDDDLLLSITQPNGVVSTHSYDLADRLLGIDTKDGSDAIVSAYAYTYDKNGNRETQVETNGGITETTGYTYDALNRLETVTHPVDTNYPNGRIVTYAYDQVGNRERETERDADDNLLAHKRGFFDNVHRLTRLEDLLDPAGTVDFTYDANGNQVAKTTNGVTTTYAYDVRDKLMEAGQGSSILGRFQYDFDGRRTKKIGEFGVAQYVYDDTSLLSEFDGAGSEIAKYDYGSDRLISLTRATEGRRYYTLDALRSVVNLTDDAGATVTSYHLDPWGNFRFPTELNLSRNRFSFTGHLYDRETDLIFAKARYLDPELGRFISQDSFLGELNDPPSLHRYLYAAARPTFFVDPTGRGNKEAKDEAQYDAILGLSFGLNFMEGIASLPERLAEGFANLLTPGSETNEGAFAQRQREMLKAAADPRVSSLDRFALRAEATKMQVGVVVEETVVRPFTESPARAREMAVHAEQAQRATSAAERALHVLEAIRAGADTFTAMALPATFATAGLKAPATRDFALGEEAAASRQGLGTRQGALSGEARATVGVTPEQRIVAAAEEAPKRGARGTVSGYEPLRPHPTDPNVPGGAANYRGRYNAALDTEGQPRLPADWDVHHSVPQQLRGDPRLQGIDIDAPSQMRGVPGYRQPGPQTNVHSVMDQEWRQFLRSNPNATREELLNFRGYQDWRFQHTFWESQARPKP